VRFPLLVVGMFASGFLIGFYGLAPRSDAGLEAVLPMPTSARPAAPMGGPFVPLSPRDLGEPGFPDLAPYPPEPPRVLEPRRLPVSEDETEFGCTALKMSFWGPCRQSPCGPPPSDGKPANRA